MALVTPWTPFSYCCTLFYFVVLRIIDGEEMEKFYDDYSTRSKEIYTEKMRDV